MPTKSSCSSTEKWSRHARTPSCSPGAVTTRTCITSSYWKRNWKRSNLTTLEELEIVAADRVSPVFLGTPGEIQEEIGRMIKNSVLMKIAVAFVGRHWRNLFADYNGRVQLICWLSSANTNPYAVEEMRN